MAEEAEIREGLFYTEEHEWIFEEDGLLQIGISDHAQKSLGDIVFLELPEVDNELTEGEPFGTIESVKAAEDLYAPITGIVVEANTDLNDSPELVNSEPYDSWLIKVKDFDRAVFKSLMDAGAYRKFLNAQLD